MTLTGASIKRDLASATDTALMHRTCTRRIPAPGPEFTSRGNKSTGIRRCFLTSRTGAVRLTPSLDLQRISAARRALTSTGRVAAVRESAPDFQDARSSVAAPLASFALILVIVAAAVACTLR